MSSEIKESKYFWYLPAIYQTKGDTPSFLGQFLKAFEKVLSGIDDGMKVNIDGQIVDGIERILDNIHDNFDPDVTDEDFLPWLAGWVALSFKDGERWSGERWSSERIAELERERELMIKIVPLYLKRGTKEGLEEYLKIYLGEKVQKIKIIDEKSPFQIGVNSTVGKDTIIDGLPLYFFVVNVFIPTTDIQERKKIEKSIRKIIDTEKPAHTSYQIKF